MNNAARQEQSYLPSEHEPYMNSSQLEYFKSKLEKWKEDLLSESRETIAHLKEENWHNPDFNDRATVETDTAFELRTRDRYRKLLDKIEDALQRIENRSYGYCEVTGDEIGIRRLEARPVATLSIEAQEQHESYERHHNDDD
jgi:DnaK suppressor protein